MKTFMLLTMALLAMFQTGILLVISLYEIQLGNLLFLVSLSPALLLMTLCVYKGWPRLVPELEPEVQEKWVETISDPLFDPVRGIYSEVLIGTEKYKILLQPNWWPFLSSAVIRNEKEAACIGSVVSPIPSGKEPGFLVVLQNTAGETKGMGSRVRLNGKSVLLTAYHVCETTDTLYIAKYCENEARGKRVKIEKTWLADFAAKDKDVDIIGIEVPAKVWSSLGVSEGKTRVPATTRIPISVFGADNASKVKSSQSTAVVASNFTGYHSATTTHGWSGSPIVNAGFVVGVHRGCDRTQIGVNKFTPLHPIMLSPEVETEPDSGKNSEIDAEEAKSRPYEFSETDFYGRGKVRHANNEWYVADEPVTARASGKSLVNYKPLAGQRAWADIVEFPEEDDDDLGPVWYEAEGSFDNEPLNSQGVSSVAQPTSTPSKESAATDSTNIPSQSLPPVWDYTSLENRVLVSEKLLEQLLMSQLTMQGQLSQICATLTGLSAEAKPSLIPCSTKQVATDEPKPPPTSEPPVTNSAKSIPVQGKGPVSPETGIAQPSKRPSRRSRKGKSKVTPPQESPLQS